MVKHKVIIALLFTFLASPVYTFAQQKKDKHVPEQEQSAPPEEEPVPSRREEKRKLKEERRRQKEEERRKEEEVRERYRTRARPAPATNTGFKYPPTEIKSRYRIHVLASLYLDELVQKRSAAKIIPEKALAGVSVYEGVSIAADSLKRAGYNIDIYVHDITTDGESIDSLIAKRTIDSADLIIGAVKSDDILRVADYAKKKRINFVSTLADNDGGVRNNKYFTSLQPSLKSQCRRIMNEVTNKFPGTNVSLLYRTTSAANENAYKYIIANDEIVFKQRQCNTLPDKQELAAIFDLTKPNIVIIPIMEAGFADTLLRKLSKDFPTTHFEIYGMPTWTTIKGLRKENMFQNLGVNIPTSCTIDLTSPAAKYVTRQYKEFFGGKATEPVYCAYETMMWYAALLKQYGTMFNTGYSDNTAAPFTKFTIRQIRDADGHMLYNENRNIMMTRFEGGVSRTQ
ncbi:MAG: hypothetical protein K0Q79_1573 [Flavipsychrobacter sp.]|jgi:hypothetical protein|nr:hypothetical protein [Flavipsychrobacter sp.]